MVQLRTSQTGGFYYVGNERNNRRKDGSDNGASVGENHKQGEAVVKVAAVGNDAR